MKKRSDLPGIRSAAGDEPARKEPVLNDRRKTNAATATGGASDGSGARQIVTMRGRAGRRGGDVAWRIDLGGDAAENGRITQLGPAARIENLSAARKAWRPTPRDASSSGLVDITICSPGPRLEITQRIAGASYGSSPARAAESCHDAGSAPSTECAASAAECSAA
jgi:hypothetical protein